MLKVIWNDIHIRLGYNLRLMISLVSSIVIHACVTLTLTAEFETRIKTFETKNFRKLLGVTYKDRITNDEIRNRISQAGRYTDILTNVKRRKITWYGHVTRFEGLSKLIQQGNIEGKIRCGRPKKMWIDNIKEWTNKSLGETQLMAHKRKEWRIFVLNVTHNHDYPS